MSDDKKVVEDIKITAVTSIPRIGWNDHWGCVQHALAPFRIPIRRFMGAFWGQCMQRVLEQCIDDELDWILTLDYDTMFSRQHLDRLLGHFGNHPEIDAIAALQCRRRGDTPLLTTGATTVEINGNPIKVATAHFGLTLIRVAALREVPKPWMREVPDDRGEWGDDRIDSDVWFWKQWEKAGKTAYVAPDVRVGHLEIMVSEFSEKMEQRHVHVTEWNYREGLTKQCY